MISTRDGDDGLLGRPVFAVLGDEIQGAKKGAKKGTQLLFNELRHLIPSCLPPVDRVAQLEFNTKNE